LGHDGLAGCGRFGAALIRARIERIEKRVRQSRALRRIMLWGRRGSLWLWPFGAACCGGEAVRSLLERADLRSSGVEIAPSWRDADVLVVSGGLTLKGLPALLRVLAEMPEPKWILALGHGADELPSETYADAGGVSEALPVDVRIPGCPPSPESLMEGLDAIRGLIGSGD
jgi:NADH-quinone oxidoreductase subunit B